MDNATKVQDYAEEMLYQTTKLIINTYKVSELSDEDKEIYDSATNLFTLLSVKKSKDEEVYPGESIDDLLKNIERQEKLRKKEEISK